MVALVGCENNSTPGGPGATNNTPQNQPVIGQGEETFSLDVPTLKTTIEQGESKSVSISLKRGKNFDQDVTLKFENVPQGVTIAPALDVIKHSEKEAKLTVTAAPDAALGDFTIKVTGHPAVGADATSELKIKVEQK